MSRKSYILIAVLLVVVIGIVFFAPTVDLQPTAMRALEAATAIFLAIAAVGHTLSGTLVPTQRDRKLLVDDSEPPSYLSEISLVDLNCARLC
jgi:hypothetical protein